MPTASSQARIRWLCRTAILVVMQAAVAGCAYLPTLDKPPEPIIAPQLPPTPEPAEPPEVVAEPAPEPVDTTPVVVKPPPPPKVAVVISNRAEAYEGVANELSAMLEDFEIYDLSDKSLTQKEAHDTIKTSGAAAVVAIGMRAAVFAAGFEDIPVVYSQVFNTGELPGDGERFRGVSAIPPLKLQLDAWKALNPDLKNVGAILGDGHDALIEEATLATRSHDMRLHYRLAQSDREALYLFTRLVPEIDGFWLFPDNRILSSEVLREMLAYAGRHRIQVAVFNDSLLALGATLSTTAEDKDIAQQIVTVLRGMLDGPADAVPPLTPLSRISVRTNGRAATAVARDAVRNVGSSH